MLDIYQELKNFISALNKAKVDYALCGGMAMAVYGIPRATMDIDILIQGDSLEKVKSLGRSMGYKMEARPMSFVKRAIQIHRISKVDSKSRSIIWVDILLVTPKLKPIWESREEVTWEGRPLWVVSRKGLVFLKALRGSGQDRDDIRKLKGGQSHEG